MLAWITPVKNITSADSMDGWLLAECFRKVEYKHSCHMRDASLLRILGKLISFFDIFFKIRNEDLVGPRKLI